MKILVTGSGGQLGSEIVKQLGREALPTTRKTLDITNFKRCQEFIQFEQPDVIINCAAFTSINAAEYRKSDECFRVNVDGVKNLIRASKCTIVQISPDYVFDGKYYGSLHEGHKRNPLNVYGKSKLAAEEALAEGARNRCYIIRTSGLYAAGFPNFVTKVLKDAKAGMPMSYPDDLITHLTYVPEVAAAILQVVKNEPRQAVFHIANRGVCSLYQYAQEICKLADIPAKITSCKRRTLNGANRPERIELSQMAYELNYGQMKTWQQGLRQFLKDIGITIKEPNFKKSDIFEQFMREYTRRSETRQFQWSPEYWASPVEISRF